MIASLKELEAFLLANQYKKTGSIEYSREEGIHIIYVILNPKDNTVGVEFNRKGDSWRRSFRKRKPEDVMALIGDYLENPCSS